MHSCTTNNLEFRTWSVSSTATLVLANLFKADKDSPISITEPAFPDSINAFSQQCSGRARIHQNFIGNNPIYNVRHNIRFGCIDNSLKFRFLVLDQLTVHEGNLRQPSWLPWAQYDVPQLEKTVLWVIQYQCGLDCQGLGGNRNDYSYQSGPI